MTESDETAIIDIKELEVILKKRCESSSLISGTQALYACDNIEHCDYQMKYFGDCYCRKESWRKQNETKC